MPFIPFLAAVAVHGHTVGFSLAWDDPMLLEYLRSTYEGGGLVALMKAGFAFKYPVVVSTGYYRPVVLLSLWLDSLFTWLGPAIFHLTNVTLHGLNSVLLYFAVLLLSRSRRAALLSSLLFAIHPVNVEAVTFVSSRSDLWATFFLLTALVVRLRWWEACISPCLLPRVFAGGAFFLALLAKESAYAFPLLIPLLEWRLGDGGPVSLADWRARVGRWLLPLSIPLALSLALRASVAGSPAGSFSLLADPGLLADRLLWYLRLLTIPWPLNALYQQESLTPTPLTLLGVTLFLLLAGVASSRRFEGLGILGSAWVVVFIAPALFGIPTQGSAAIAERYLYLPSLGLACTIGVVLDRTPALWRDRRIWTPVLVLLALALVGGTVRRSLVWKDDVALFEDIVAKNPGLAEARVNLGAAYRNQGRLEEAIAEFRRALAIKPDFGPALIGLGGIAEKKGDTAEAERSYRRAASAMPTYGQPRFLLGELYSRARSWKMAATEFEAAVRVAPDMASAWYDLGAANANLGDYQRSAEAYERAVALRPDNPSWRYWLGVTYLLAGKPEMAQVQRQWLESRDPALAGRLTTEIVRRARSGS